MVLGRNPHDASEEVDAWASTRLVNCGGSSNKRACISVTLALTYTILISHPH